jgi:hypothetical protein
MHNVSYFQISSFSSIAVIQKLGQVLVICVALRLKVIFEPIE